MDDDEIQEILLGIHSRLGQIDGKTSLNVRANRETLLESLRELVQNKPLVGQVYLVADGKQTQSEVREALLDFGLAPNAMAVSRAFDVAFENGLLARRRTPKGKQGKVWAHDHAMESILHLTKRIPEWLAANDEVAPLKPKRKRKRKPAAKKPAATKSSVSNRGRSR